MSKLLRFRDLKASGIVGNHLTLARWVKEEGFPPGLMLGRNTRVWRESDVEEWIASRPVENKWGQAMAAKRAAERDHRAVGESDAA